MNFKINGNRCRILKTTERHCKIRKKTVEKTGFDKKVKFRGRMGGGVFKEVIFQFERFRCYE